MTWAIERSFLLPPETELPRGATNRQLTEWLQQPLRVRARPWWSEVSPGQFRRDDGAALGYGRPATTKAVLGAMNFFDGEHVCSQRVRP